MNTSALMITRPGAFAVARMETVVGCARSVTLTGEFTSRWKGASASGDDTDALIAIDHLVASTDVDVLGVEVLDEVRAVNNPDDSDVVEDVPEQAEAAMRRKTRAEGLM